MGQVGLVRRPARHIKSGKVHGSLARAGKVRGQTPKVAKQDKKKKPRGRAHKRMQYNRRFVTAGEILYRFLLNHRVTSSIAAKNLHCCFTVVGFGKKRGPNSSEK
ncbi:40S ribosomal protein S30 [Platanthera guangdongensis]|uniref:40S ribosomal protein S30 n=1 Tax=Platanthera guangdongensis TaxID=2320717 RepID=A0ABR2ME09_9ASPA